MEDLRDYKRLNLGSGNRPMKGYVNIDKFDLPLTDIVHDLNKFPYPFKDNQFEEIYARGVLSELDCFIRVMEELYSVSKNKAKIIIEEPLFGELAFQHPLTKKVFTLHSFDYFPSYYSKANFKVKSIKTFYSHHKLNWLVNWILKPRYAIWELEVLK